MLDLKVFFQKDFNNIILIKHPLTFTHISSGCLVNNGNKKSKKKKKKNINNYKNNNESKREE